MSEVEHTHTHIVGGLPSTPTLNSLLIHLRSVRLGRWGKRKLLTPANSQSNILKTSKNNHLFYEAWLHCKHI